MVSIDATKSKWYLWDTAIRAVQSNIKAKLDFARDFTYKDDEERPCVMQNLNIDRTYFKQSISQFG